MIHPDDAEQVRGRVVHGEPDQMHLEALRGHPPVPETRGVVLAPGAAEAGVVGGEVGAQVGLDPPPYDHSLGAVFTDVNGDGRPDLYVANDFGRSNLYRKMRALGIAPKE